MRAVRIAAVRGTAANAGHYAIARRHAAAAAAAAEGGAELATASLAVGLFSASLRTSEVIPFPIPKLDEDMQDTFGTLEAGINKLSPKSIANAEAVTSVLGKTLSVYGASLPEELGGLGLTGPAQGLAMHAVASSPVLLPYFASHVVDAIATEALLTANATHEQRGKWFPDMAEGGNIVVWADREILGGDDLSEVTTRAEHCVLPLAPKREGDAAPSSDEGADDSQRASQAPTSVYKLTGRKLCTTNAAVAARATHALVVSQVPTQVPDPTTAGGPPTIKDRLTWFMVDLKAAEAEGTLVRETDVATGVVTLAFTNTTVPVDSIVGTVGDGAKIGLITALTRAPIIAGAVAAAARAFVNDVLAKTGPISRLASSAQHTVLSAAVQSLAAQVYALDTVAGLVATNLYRDVPDAMVECLICAQLAEHVAQSVQQVATLLQPTFTSNKLHDTARHIRQLASRASTFGSDTTRYQAACIGLEDYGLQFIATSTLSTMFSRMQRSAGIRDKLKGIDIAAPERALIESAAEKLNEAVERVVVRAGPQAKDRHLALGRIADSNAWLFATIAVLSRAQTVTKADAKLGASEVAIATQYCRMVLPLISEYSLDVITAGKTADDSRVALFFDTLQAVL